MQSEDLAAFNALLSKNNLNPLQVSPSTLTNPSCTFAPSAVSTKAPVKK
jgi:hypothetical protein